MDQLDQKVLIAFDDSENATRAVSFVARLFSTQTHVTLFNVAQDTAVLCEMNSPELTPYFIAQQSHFCVLEDKKKKIVDQAMDNAVKILLDAGFDRQRIALKIEMKKKGVARDIVNEARSGHDIIILGRRGVSGIRDFLLGSVSQKVFQLAKDLSVLVVN